METGNLERPVVAADAGAAPSIPYPNVAKMLRVIMLARNEERDMPLALSCIPVGIGITVIDSGCSDRTPEIARAAGCHIYSDAGDVVSANRGFLGIYAPAGGARVPRLDLPRRGGVALLHGHRRGR
jgi:glycosyltransferase involved in cell wall biosynthesis